MNFVNQKLDRLGLSVQNLDTQVGTQLWGPPEGKGRGVQVREKFLWGRGSRGLPLCGPGCVASQSRGVLLSSGGWVLLGGTLWGPHEKGLWVSPAVGDPLVCLHLFTASHARHLGPCPCGPPAAQRTVAALHQVPPWGRTGILPSQPGAGGCGLPGGDRVPVTFPLHRGDRRGWSSSAQGLRGGNGACWPLATSTGCVGLDVAA